MNHMRQDLITRVMVRFGLPRGESPLFYRDVALGCVFVVAALVTVVLGYEFRFSVVFWVAAAIAALSLLVATKRVVLIAALFGIAAIRFALSALLMLSPMMIVPAAICAALAVLIASRDSTAYPTK